MLLNHMLYLAYHYKVVFAMESKFNTFISILQNVNVKHIKFLVCLTPVFIYYFNSSTIYCDSPNSWKIYFSDNNYNTYIFNFLLIYTVFIIKLYLKFIQNIINFVLKNKTSVFLLLLIGFLLNFILIKILYNYGMDIQQMNKNHFFVILFFNIRWLIFNIILALVLLFCFKKKIFNKIFTIKNYLISFTVYCFFIMLVIPFIKNLLLSVNFDYHSYIILFSGYIAYIEGAFKFKYRFFTNIIYFYTDNKFINKFNYHNFFNSKSIKYSIDYSNMYYKFSILKQLNYSNMYYKPSILKQLNYSNIYYKSSILKQLNYWSKIPEIKMYNFNGKKFINENYFINLDFGFNKYRNIFLNNILIFKNDLIQKMLNLALCKKNSTINSSYDIQFSDCTVKLDIKKIYHNSESVSMNINSNNNSDSNNNYESDTVNIINSNNNSEQVVIYINSDNSSWNNCTHRVDMGSTNYSNVTGNSNVIAGSITNCSPGGSVAITGNSRDNCINHYYNNYESSTMNINSNNYSESGTMNMNSNNYSESGTINMNSNNYSGPDTTNINSNNSKSGHINIIIMNSNNNSEPAVIYTNSNNNSMNNSTINNYTINRDNNLINS